MSAKPAFNLADLRQGAKQLHTVEATDDSKSSSAKQDERDDEERRTRSALETLYDQHEGNLDAM